MGVPQGGIISPLLSNLVLHELDVYMEGRIKERIELSGDESPSRNNPEYYRVSNQVRLQKKKGGGSCWGESSLSPSAPY